MERNRSMTGSFCHSGWFCHSAVGPSVKPCCEMNHWSKTLGLSQGAVRGYLSRARAAGVSAPLAEDLDDVQLEALLFPPPPAIAADQRPMPDWAWVHRELRRPNVTLALLWEEHRALDSISLFLKREPKNSPNSTP